MPVEGGPDRPMTFGEHVIDSLARLHTKVDFANGRLASVEKQVRLHERALWMIMGGGILVGWAVRYLVGFLK